MPFLFANGDQFDTNAVVATCDITTQGVNGRDQVAAFAAFDTIYIHNIFTGGFFGTHAWLASLSAASPNLPGGWSIASPSQASIVLNGSGQFYNTIFGFFGGALGAPTAPRFSNSVGDCLVLNGGSAVSASANTAIDLSDFVPADAIKVQVQILGANGGTATLHYISSVSGDNAIVLVSGANSYDTVVAELSLVTPQTIYYSNGASGGLMYVRVVGYN